MTNGWLGCVAFAAGAAVLVVELMAVRLLSPWFGQSQIVWTHVIGVVLAALALGQWLGGRWADGQRGGPGPALLLLAAGGWTMAMPDLVRVVGAAVVPDALPLLEAYPFVTWGSLLVAVLALGLPLLALGALTPWLVRLSRDVSREPGATAGRILGAGTAGSLAGTFGATHVLLPSVGSAAAVQIAGGVLVLLGVLVGRRHARPPVAGLLVLLVPVVFDGLPGREPLDGRLLQRIESPYQLIRVAESGDGTRSLRLNEGLDSFHSVFRPGHFWSGTYFDAFLLPSLWAPAAHDGRRDVLVLGLAAGTMPRQLLEVAPESRVRGVELDECVVDVGRRWFGLPPQVDVVAGVDARVALAADPGRYGAILVDAYAQQIYLPPHLCTIEFFRLLQDRLLPNGVAALNIGGTSREDPVVCAVAGTFAEVFPNALMARVPGTRNMMVMGFQGATPSGAELEARLSELPLPSLEPDAIGIGWAWESSALAAVEPAGKAALRDGRDAVEALAHAAWRGERAAPAGGSHGLGRTVSQGLESARLWMSRTDWPAALIALEEPLRDRDPKVRAQALLLAGNIAFERSDFAVAMDFYDQCSRTAAPLDSGAALEETSKANHALAGERASASAAAASKAGRLRIQALGLSGIFAATVAALGWRRRPRVGR